MRLTIPEEEIMNPGHLACQGCGATLAVRFVLKGLGRNTIMSIPACCCTVIDGPFPYSAYGIPIWHTAFETAASAASGIKAGLDILGRKETTVLAWAGDGGTFDIGIQALSGAAERGDDMIYVCYDNEAYMNTGIQRSSATPYGAWTTTTPVKHPKNRPKKDIVAIMAAHRISYTATASIGYPEDLVKKVKRAKESEGTKFLHIIAPCPTGWRSRPDDTIKLAKLVVETKIFPLFEVENGEVWRLTKKSKGTPVIDYLKLQGRFRHLKEEDVQTIQMNVNKEYERLLKRCNESSNQ